MAKTLLFFSDGTWNGVGQDDDGDGVPDVTNVLKLFGMLCGRDDTSLLKLRDEQERTFANGGSVQQVAKYIHGVGDSDNWLVKVLGGAFGSGVVTRIVRGYTFVSRQYEPGDDIVLVGFSRGAYTVRALAGLIAAKGLLDSTKTDLDDRQQAYRLGCAAWESHRKVIAERIGGITRLRQALSELPRFFDNADVEGLLTGPVGIKCVAVWDTVGALGIPRYDGDDMRIDTFQFADSVLSDRVQFGLHAVAIDEQRRDFTPTLWQQRTGITQMLFAGAHADVGGGYPSTESGLANTTLHWMREELSQLGVRFLEPAEDLDSRYAASALSGSHRPWLEPLFALKPRRERDFTAFPDLQLHPSVVARCAHSGGFDLYVGERQESYDPLNVRYLRS